MKKINSSFILGMLITLSSQLVLSKSVSQKDMQKKKQVVDINLSLESKLHENLDEHVLNDGVGEDVILTEVKAGADTKFKALGINLKSKTNFSLSYTDQNSAYKSIELINRDNVDMNVRKLSLSQSFSTRKKISKKLSLNATIEGEIAKGHSIAQDFEDDVNNPNYHLIDESFQKIGTILGASYKVSKKARLRALYRFSQYDFENPYDFDETQGSNDRRIHTYAIRNSYKLNKNIRASLTAQIDNITYRDRLALTDQGFYTQEGTAEISSLQDQTLKASAKLFKKLDISFSRVQREDLVGQGENSVQNQLSAKLGQKVGVFDIRLEASLASKDFSNAVADNLNEKRSDTIRNNKFLIGYQINQTLSSNFSIENRENQSNNSFSDTNFSIMGIGLSGRF